MSANQDVPEKSKTLLHRIQVLILIFMVGAVIGFVYEEVFYLINDGVWSKRGVTFGPWITIYGVGAMLLLAVTHKVRRKPLPVFLISVVVTGVLEFAVGFYLWNVHEVRLWDYNTEIWNWGNIDGYVCARSVLLFGLMGLMLQFWIRPAVEKLAERLRPATLAVIAFSAGGLYVVDLILTLILA